MDWGLIFLCLLFTCILIQALHSILRKQPAGKLPPGPKPYPIIGNLLELGDKPHKSLAKLATTHGPIMRLKLGQVTTIVISSASMAKQVLQVHDQNFSSRTVPDAISAHKHDQYSVVWLPATTTWRNLRKICNSNLFTTKKLDSTQTLRCKKMQELVSGVQESSRVGEAVEIGQAAFKTSLNLLSNTIFSIDLADPNSDTAREFKKEVEGVMEEGGKPNIADCFHVLRKIDPQGARRRLGNHSGKLLDIIRRMIEHRAAQKKSNSTNDMLDTLFRINREENLHMTLIEHLLIDLFSAGTDTTSKTVEWVMAELLHSPEKLRKAQAELEENIGRGNQVRESDISNLVYLQAVVKESMRLHPTVPLILRKSEDNVEICGYTVPKGAQVMVNMWAIGRDPTTWENPNSFEPERFLVSEIDVKGRNFELIPFGAGRRICPGMPLAIRMVHLTVASLIHGIEWELEDGANGEEMNMEDKYGLTLAMAVPVKAVPVVLALI